VSAVDRVVGAVTGHTRIAIAVMVVLTAIVGAGAGAVEQESSLEQFQSDTPEAKASDYISTNFTTGPENTTSVQIIVRGDNVLSKDSLLESLAYQQRIREDQRVSETLTDDRPTIGIANVLALSSIQRNVSTELQATSAEFEELNETVRAQQTALEANISQFEELNETIQAERATLDANATRLEQRQAEVNATSEALRSGLTTLLEDENASVSAVFEQTNEETPVELDGEAESTFEQAATQLRNADSDAERQQAYRLGTQGVLEDELTNLEAWGQSLDDRETALEGQGQELESLGEQIRQQRESLEARSEELETLGAELQALQEDLGAARSASLDRQIETIESLNASQLDALIEGTLDPDRTPNADQGLGFMPVGDYYDPGATSAEATVILVSQQTDSPSVGGGTATQAITDAQLAMQELGDEQANGVEFVVFGSGIITDEINQSMTDSMTIVGPLALLFVLIALALGYRDLLDIILGLLGIFAVLIWTFGFMGWMGIDFNQIFIAVPVLLIGLSIDYAIHIFMRHREERFEMGNGDLRGSMKVALTGVGVALALVTATTVIGFMSNLISPLPPIQDFGVVSSFGILAAFLIFGVLIPALKIEIDEFLESRGFDRKKRAIGTGGGRLSEGLKIGSIGAKRSAYAVIVVALVVSALGIYGASQVDTSFSNEDFLADDPPEWLKDLPEPFAPGDYRTKANLEYVNERFQREDSTADILIRGDVATDSALEQLQRAQSETAGKEVTQILASGDASVKTPVSVLEETRQNPQFEDFDQFVADQDTDNDGLPDENVTAVYDRLFDLNPQQAGQVLYRTDDGEYAAARFAVGIKGTAAGPDTMAQMRAAAATVEEGSDLRAVATGQPILFEIVQDQLLDTVIESLLITLVAIIGFLMIVYRVTDGSATLGFVTLLPVVLSVTWILGTMFLLGIPFNVLTGMITSLTVGLGVAYSIHISERYNQELERYESAWEALDRSVTGTGGALLGSAATTVGGFGTLAFALLPSLQQFGIITGLTIIYAFLASVLVLPSLLVVWTRFVGPAEKLDIEPTSTQATESPTDD
jgi:predicted RND superfamily exporter protein